MQIVEPQVTVSTAQQLGLTPEEFEKIQEILGRTPNFTELSIFSVMWSEHCSYKNSIIWLKTLPRDGERLLVGAGEENAGLVDIGDGLACAFKIESHNHPSAIEPYQGAATGVGGIHRDIFTMGARPIAALNSLRFGNPELPHTKRLIRGVVKGIGNYGNSFGVPTVGGEVYFNDCYNQNILVNAMSVGIVKVGETVSARADGPGNPVHDVGVTGLALLAGLAIFPVVIEFLGAPSGGGPGLIFTSLPSAFNQMGAIFGLLFFVLLSVAAWTSSISLLEPATAFLVEKGFRRKPASLGMALLCWALGLLSVFGFNHLSHIKPLGQDTILDAMNLVANDILLPLGGLLIALFAGWVLRDTRLREQLFGMPDWMFTVWRWLVRVVAPALVLVVLVRAFMPH